MNKLHWFALSKVPGVGGATARRLIERFGSIEAIFNAPIEELQRVPRLKAEAIAQLLQVCWESLEAELNALAEEGIRVLTWDEPDYPANLLRTTDAPPVLFVRGNLLPSDKQAVAIIGTRKPTVEAVEVAEGLAFELAARGLAIVSGLALGIDTTAHRGALRAEGGRTLAVLGSGLRLIHPRSNRPLAEEIIRRGALLSELQPDAPPLGANLMARDRLISGLSRAVIVVQAGEEGGSLDTALRASRQSRLVFAVPGSPGTDLLIAQGAKSLDPKRINPDELIALLQSHTESQEEPDQLTLWNE